MMGSDDVILMMAQRVADALRGLCTDDEILRACEEEYPQFAAGCGVVEYRSRVIDNLASAETRRSATKRGIRVKCAVCGRDKRPIGRSASIQSYLCADECPGYDQAPYVGSLWPGETDADFGYPCGDHGTEPVT